MRKAFGGRGHFPVPDPGDPVTTSPVRFLVWLVTRHRGSLALATVFGVLCTLAQALVPVAIGFGIDRGRCWCGAGRCCCSASSRPSSGRCATGRRP